MILGRTTSSLSKPCEPCTSDARCDTCGDRMCETNGPKPRACRVTCDDCPCACTPCWDARIDAELERRRLAERDAL